MKHHQPHRQLRRNGGFTLLEMVIVLGIIAMLLGGAIYSSLGILGSSKMGRADADFQTISSNLMQYRTANGFYPSTSQGLKALVERPSANPVPRRWSQIMKKMPLDPWDSEYIYRFPGKKNATEPEIISKGPDGLENTQDDLSSQDTK
jgi:general secretion pathway protein G